MPRMPTAQIRPNPDVAWRRVEDEVVLVNLKTNRIYNLNRTASRFWELLNEGLQRETLERKMLEEFDVDESHLRREIDALIGELSSEGLVS